MSSAATASVSSIPFEDDHETSAFDIGSESMLFPLFSNQTQRFILMQQPMYLIIIYSRPNLHFRSPLRSMPPYRLWIRWLSRVFRVFEQQLRCSKGIRCCVEWLPKLLFLPENSQLDCGLALYKSRRPDERAWCQPISHRCETRYGLAYSG
jgi:hypothetical protein